MDPRIRQITIKTGVVKRLAKEKLSYEKEAQTNRDRIEKFKAVSREQVYKGDGKWLDSNLRNISGGKRRPCDSERGGMSARVLDDGAGLPAKVTINSQITCWVVEECPGIVLK